jgi:hypothetical protein
LLGVFAPGLTNFFGAFSFLKEDWYVVVHSERRKGGRWGRMSGWVGG